MTEEVAGDTKAETAAEIGKLIMGNPCIRCGRERVDVKTYREYAAGNSLVTHTITACPDKACQEAVEKRFAKEKERRETLKNHRI